MRFLKPILTTLVIILFEQFVSGQHRNKLSIVETNKQGIDHIISEIYITSINQHNKEKAVIVLNLRIDSVNQEIRIALLNKDDFRWLLRDKVDELYGISEFRDVPILVFGNNAKVLFATTGIRRNVNWVNTKRSVHSRQKPSKQPPIIFEPEVMVYTLNKDSIQFKCRGFYTIIW